MIISTLASAQVLLPSVWVTGKVNLDVVQCDWQRVHKEWDGVGK